MLYSLNTLKGFDLQTKEGQIGKLDEVYFDDGCWWIRYLVVNVGNWLKPQRVLLAPEEVLSIDPDSSVIEVALTKKEVENSPDALEVTPVSREREIALHHHYDRTPSWNVDPLGAAGFGRVPNTIIQPGNDVKANVDHAYDATAFAGPQVRDRATAPFALRPSGRVGSSLDAHGYHIQAQDGEIGHLDDFLVDPDFEAINYLVVDTQNWLPGKKVVVLPQFVQNIQWNGSKIHVALTKEQIKNAPDPEPRR